MPFWPEGDDVNDVSLSEDPRADSVRAHPCRLPLGSGPEKFRTEDRV
jgi:hypothetical protein